MDKEIVKNRTFAYIIYEMILWHMELKKDYSVKDFNDRNDFGFEKLLHYPFFIFAAATIQNRERLLDLFDGFSFQEIGIIETKLKDYFPVLDPFVVDDSRTYIRDDFQRFTGEISKKAFEKFFLGLETIPIIKACIDQLKSRNIDFVHHDLQTLMFHNRRHDIWQFAAMMKEYAGRDCVLSPDKLLTTKSIYSSDPQLFTCI